jgi:hypothetical protein
MAISAALVKRVVYSVFYYRLVWADVIRSQIKLSKEALTVSVYLRKKLEKEKNKRQDEIAMDA